MSQRRNQNRYPTKQVCVGLYAGLLVSLVGIGGCPTAPSAGDGNGSPSTEFNNRTDPTNGGGTYIGSAACIACHTSLNPDILAKHRLHGHAHILNRVQGTPPTYPAEATRAGVSSAPPGRTFLDVSYVIGGYTKVARYVDQAGYVMTTGALGVDAQWNLSLPANGAQPGLAPFDAAQTTPLPYDYDCFRCHTTGAQPQDPDNPQFQDSRPGMAGSFAEAGVMCEACHGPGSNHAPNPAARTMYVNESAANCGRCHAGSDPDVIEAAGGFVAEGQQWAELRASGGHSDFDCTICHDPHTSVNYADGIRNVCNVCHANMTLGFHEGAVFVRGDYREPLTCQSCHMPYGSLTGSIGTPDVVGASARVGDTRTHIFRITTADADYTSMFTPDGTAVVKDSAGRAAVTLDFVCLRCHNAIGNAFALTVKGAAGIAPTIHTPLH